MKRVTLFRNGTNVDGKALAVDVDQSIEDLLSQASSKLGIIARKIYTKNGGLIDSIELIKDDDVLYVSSGEAFMSVDSFLPKHIGTVMSAQYKLQQEDKEWITLNVGGKYFTTTRSTLTREDGSMLARMFAVDNEVDGPNWSSTVDSNGAYLIDRSPTYFEPILNYLRHGQLVMDDGINPKGVLEEVRFFGVLSLVDALEDEILQHEPPSDLTPITRREFVLSLMSTPSNCELRCQGLNFTGANLSKLDLRYVNFKYALLHKTNMSGANVSYCNFERANISYALLDGANLLGTKMLCVNLEGSKMIGCNFEDPAGSRANMEGANMKYVNLDGSHMAGVNLRVATLKNANLQNCDLRGAVLAGADLENCDLSGCDLQEANLRGANLKGAAFELMLNPLNMAQVLR